MSEDLFPPLGDIIKDARILMELSLPRLAYMIDVPWQRISSWERNKSMPTQRQAHKILDILPWHRPHLEEAIEHYYEEISRDDVPWPEYYEYDGDEFDEDD